MSRSTTRARSFISCTAVYIIAAAAACLFAARLDLPTPIFKAAAADIAATVLVFAGSLLFNNSSIYDPYWSAAPVPIAIFWAMNGSADGNPASLRAILVMILLCVWAIRLTANWARRWLGLGHEDWRYSDFRRFGAPAYWIVSFLGFHFFPTVLVFLGCLSLYPVLAAPLLHFRLLDLAAAAITVLAIWIEARSDRELREFLKTSHEPREILQRGLWAWSRHPNYFGEVLFWWGLYLFALAANPAFWWAAVGPLSITLLFMLVSVPMMERHMSAGHLGYAERQRSRSPLVPWFHRNT